MTFDLALMLSTRDHTQMVVGTSRKWATPDSHSKVRSEGLRDTEE